MARGDMRNQPKAQPDQRRYVAKPERPGEAVPAADIGLRKRRARQAERAVEQAKRNAGNAAEAAAVERRMTGKPSRAAVTPPSKPTQRRGTPRKRPAAVEKALGRHGSKGKKRAARKA